MSKIFNDPCSFSDPNYFKLVHLSLNWNIDFEKKIIFGSCIQNFELNEHKSSVDSIILDTRDLIIKNIIEENTKTNLEFKFGTNHSEFGSPLIINLSNLKNLSVLKSIKIFIEYETNANASALQWLDPNSTCGKKYPYMFSQCQAIHCRSIIPIQDTPSVKFTYDASVSVKDPLVVLMSACSKGFASEFNLKTYKFEQKMRIPSYLIAIAVGDLVSKKIGKISNVWSERELIDESAEEFSQVDDMLKDAENLLGPYVWGIYDLLVLPPTFPYGGMENPCLTFVTPTLLAKDKSLCDVIIHEITHSWTGNLVTNCSWEHFWLNEGFTRFIESKLVGIFNKGEQYRQFGLIESWRELEEEVQNFGPTNQLTQLVPNLKETHPDDAFSSIPYEKGQMLLYYLEEKLGGVEIFNKYLKAYIERFKNSSLDSNDWKAFTYEYFQNKKEILDSVDWDTWLHKPGMPPFKPSFDETLSKEILKLSEKILNEDILSADPVFNQFKCSQKKELLSILIEKAPLDEHKLKKIDEVYKFGVTENSEIKFKWLRLGIKSKWHQIIEPALKFVSIQGRMKFTRPIYTDLWNWEEARQLAIKNFETQRPFMHQTTAGLVAKDLKLSN